MNKPKKQSLMLLVPAALILFAALLMAQGPPNQLFLRSPATSR
jgi:hypothetical protein